MAALLLLGISLLVFTLLRLAPGDPFATIPSIGSDSEQVRADGAEQSLARTSWHSAYAAWLTGLLQGNFGYSLVSGQPVAAELLTSGPITLGLVGGALLVGLLISVPAGLYGALHHHGRRSAVLDMVAYGLSAMPLFWLAYLFIYLFTRQLAIFPVYIDDGDQGGIGIAVMILPVILLGLGNGMVAETIRHLREALGRALREDYARTARAKGVSALRHVYKEGVLLPVFEMAAGRLPHLIGGAVIVEQIFNLPGLGRMIWQAALDRDFPLIMGVVVSTAVLVRIASLIQGLLGAWVDPRTREG